MHIDHIEVYPNASFRVSFINVILGNSRLNVAMPKEVRDAIVTICTAEVARFMANLNISSTDILDESLRYMNQPSFFDPE